MGCDIHAYVEHRPANLRGDQMPRWQSFGGRVNPGRNYSIFERMAGVRGEALQAVVQPRGYPDDAAWRTRDDNWLWIVYGNGPAGENEATAKAAQEYVKHGSTYEPRADGGKPERVSHPDHHTHSWLTPTEFEIALNIADNATALEEPEYHALLAAMRSLEASGREVRVVFWFDN